MPVEIRKIKAEDNEAIAGIIRASLKEFKADKPGTVYFDESTDHLSDLFIKENSTYFVAVEEDRLLGGAGIFPTEGLPEGTIELVKMYLIPEARGKGLGKTLILRCLETAKLAGYKFIYLETMAELAAAVKTYENMGFEKLAAPLGNSGHHSCEIQMLKQIG